LSGRDLCSGLITLSEE